MHYHCGTRLLTLRLTEILTLHSVLVLSYMFVCLDKFPSEWQKAAERVDPEGKLLNRQLNLHGALEGSQQKSLK